MANVKRVLLSQRKMAAALGLSAARVNCMAASGMPMHDVEAAKRWRASSVEPRMPRRRGSPSTLPSAGKSKPDDDTFKPDLTWLQAFVRLCELAATDPDRYMPAIYRVYMDGPFLETEKVDEAVRRGEIPANVWTAFDAYIETVWEEEERAQASQQ